MESARRHVCRLLTLRGATVKLVQRLMTVSMSCSAIVSQAVVFEAMPKQVLSARVFVSEK